MSIFNQAAEGIKTVNLAGGEAYKVDPRYELAATLLTSFVKDQHYRTGGETTKRIEELLGLVPPPFAAKAALYARNECGMRSISHVAAGEIAKKIKGEKWTRKFFQRVFRRPDDMLEVLAYYCGKYGKRPIPNALKKGIRARLERLDDYAAAKYRGEGKAYKLVDLVNLTHPKGTPTIEKLVKGTLKSTETWEAKLTDAGQKAESDEQKAELKKEAWASLLKENKLGYLALLRNLRNIAQQAPEVLPEALAQLTDRERVKKSLVFPFQYLTALDEIQKVGLRDVMAAISQAIDISLDNVPSFPGKTLVVLDTSGSMAGQPIRIGSVFAAVLYKKNDADFMRFSDNAEYMAFMPTDSTLSLANAIVRQCKTGGTNFHAIFQTANVKYDRIIILSDMQGWVGYDSPVRTFHEYCRKTGANPKVYSFDLQNYGTLMFPQPNVFCLAGWSDKVFETLAVLEEDKNALINKIDSIEL